jgi:hypothetical protein
MIEEDGSMSYVPCRERTFPLTLADRFEVHYITYLHWLRHFLERLGREPALAAWEEAFGDYDEEPLLRILSSGWEGVEEQHSAEVEERLADALAALFPIPVEGVPAEEAREIVEGSPPFRQIRQRLPSLDLKRETTTYDALHLFRDGLALLAGTVIDRHDKAGELMVYDAMLEELAGTPRQMSVEEFMLGRYARFTTEPEEADIFSAGLQVEVIRGSETEVVHNVTECEWARYFRERHPRVGYLLACSMDDPVYRSLNERLRLQRTCTLMEGGDACDFRVYAIEEAFVARDPAG